MGQLEGVLDRWMGEQGTSRWHRIAVFWWQRCCCWRLDDEKGELWTLKTRKSEECRETYEQRTGETVFGMLEEQVVNEETWPLGRRGWFSLEVAGLLPKEIERLED